MEERTVINYGIDCLLEVESIIDINDIAMDVDYGSLGFLLSHLMHEKKRLGEVGVVEKYRNAFGIASNDYEHNFLCGFLKYYGNRNGIEVDTEPKKLDKIVIELIDIACMEEGCLTEEEFNDIDKDIIPEFKAVGIYFKRVDEAV